MKHIYDDTIVEFVARKNPKNIIVKQLADGRIKIIYEVTQDELTSAVENAVENYFNHGNSETYQP